jgi:hypothetical protein
MILAFYSETSGAGKDTAADVAAECLRADGVNVVRDAFAWDGKVVCADALGIEGTRMEKVAAIDAIKLGGYVEWRGGSDGVVDRDTPRGATLGRDFIIGLLGSPDKGNGVRGLDEGFWTRQVVHRADKLTWNEHGGRSVADYWDNWTVISDLRFQEEGVAVKRAGGRIVEIHRPHGSLGAFNEQRVPVDFKITNDGTLEQLATQVVDYVRVLRQTRTA